MSSPALEADNSSGTSFRFLLVNFDAEDLEMYRPGGFHPVHLGDYYGDNKRYRIVHKLGAGGFSTVWLARDEQNNTWVTLKIAIADESTSIEAKSLLSRNAATVCGPQASFVVEHESFAILGPNGRHICLVLPVLGPSTSQLSNGFDSRIQPSLCRRIAYQATGALSDLHAQGLCHGDMTTANILLGLDHISKYSEEDLYQMFGKPEKQTLETESGEEPGPEAPRYIVKALDFLSSNVNIINRDAYVIDFDQAFPANSPPSNMLGTPAEFLAPEVAVGRAASPASDVWALGCSIYRLRSGTSPFSGYEVTSPADLMRVVIQTIGNTPSQWGELRFDYDGQPSKDPTNGVPLEVWGENQSLKDLVDRIWDYPQGGIVSTGKERKERVPVNKRETEPYPPIFSGMFWKPSAVRIDNTFLHGYDDETDELLEAMPKISPHEATLLYDLLSRIFVYDPVDRISAAEMLRHPWFSMTGSLPED